MKGPAQAALPLQDLVEESLDEAAFLWGQWEEALSAHDRTLETVSFWIEERLLGALDGVRAAGMAAVESLLKPALEDEDVSRVTVAAHVLAAQPEGPALALLADAIKTAPPPRLALLRRAVELVPSDATLAALDRALPAAGPAVTAALIAARSFRQQALPPALFSTALASPDPALRAAAVTAIRHAPTVAGHACGAFLDAKEPAVRDAALATGLMLGLPAAWTRCREVAARPNADAGVALLLMALLGQPRDQELVIAALGDEAARREALIAAGFAGTRAAADACVQVMAQPSLARLAAEALSTITGLNLEAEGLLAAPAPPPEEPIPFEQEDLDANLVPGPDDRLPPPDVAGVARWWNAQRGRFPDGQRFTGGRPAELAALNEVLVSGPMRRRHAMALELAIRSGGRYQVETRAHTRQQRRQMATFGQAVSSAGRAPLARTFSAA